MDDEDLDELYVGDFDGFVARRDQLAKRLKADGDADAGKAVKALKKPNRVAWALNQFSSDGGKVRDRLLKAGEKLRQAQERVVAGDADSADLRGAGGDERKAVSESLEALEGAQLSADATERARQTLHAVALDEEVREQFESHRLTTDHDAPGLGAVPVGAAGQGAKRRKKNDEAKRQREQVSAAEKEAKKLSARRDDAEREVEAARKEADQAQHALERSQERLEEATAKADEAGERLASLKD